MRHRPRLLPLAAPITPYDPLPWVDPFIGTGGLGFGVGSVNPGPLRPFGLVKAGPDTVGPAGSIEFLHCAGYHADDDQITAISHTHLHGAGIADYGLFGLLPRAGWDPQWTTDSGRAVAFSDESARPGYYGPPSPTAYARS